MHLSEKDIQSLCDAVDRAHMAQARDALLAGIDSSFAATLPIAGSPLTTIAGDLAVLSITGKLADGSDPLRVWLSNAMTAAGPRTERSVFEHMLRRLDGVEAPGESGRAADTAEQHRIAVSSEDAGHNDPPTSLVPSSGPPVNVFIASVPADRNYMEALRTQLRGRRIWKVVYCHPEGPHADEAKWIKSAHVIVVLASADLLASHYYRDFLEPALGDVEKNKTARIVPVVVRPCDWGRPPLGRYQSLPLNGQPISTWTFIDDPMKQVAEGVADVISACREELARQRRGLLEHPPPTESLAIDHIFVAGKVVSEKDTTYVSPGQLEEIVEELATMGKGLIIEGPAGIGKTTAVRQAFEVRAMGEPRWLECSGSHARARLDEILAEGRVEGHLVLDDFHQLKSEEQREGVAALMKRTAEGQRGKIVVIGINNAGRSLLGTNSDLKGRVKRIRVGRQPPQKIDELIRKGEAAANVYFARRDELVRMADGSFFTAQLLCSHACKAQGVKRTTRDPKPIEWFAPDLVARVMEELDAFTDPLVAFAASDMDVAPRGGCFALLWLLARSEAGSVSLHEAGPRFAELSPAFDALGRRGLHRSTNNAQIERVLFLEKAQISIEDPQLTFYLRHARWREIAERAGLAVRFGDDSRPFFVPDRKGGAHDMDPPPSTERRHFLDMLPFPWWAQKAVALRDVLIAAYPTRDWMRSLALCVPVNLDRWKGETAVEAWTSLIEEAAGQRKLRLLLDKVLEDDHVSGYHDKIRRLVQA